MRVSAGADAQIRNLAYVNVMEIRSGYKRIIIL